ncbi:hypothetical protein [Domibacillus epiphyticus]|uniref:Uncharacterized protein n=1 Tax=Domibacillus epiphyticus TaxID=1714355 RepID=A0A1V2A6J4_9BACI|nr:hypothetical protein [Domibacillus epiphyticus]OMP66609.1 hypothetical protein BTO28_11215 [Domibacillus epiphyticus]
MTKAKTFLPDQSSLTRADLFSIPGVMRASDLRRVQGIGHSPEQWKETITAAVYNKLPIQQIEEHPYNTEYAAKDVYQQLLKKAPSDREWAVLFRMFAAFYTFSSLSERLDEANLAAETAERAGYDVLFYLADETFDAIKMTGGVMPFAFEPYIDLLKDDTGRLLSFPFEHFPNARLDLYRLLWDSLFTKTDWRREELQRTLPGSGSSTIQTAAHMHQLYLLGEMDKFTETAAAAPADVFLHFLHWLQDAKRSDRFIPVLRAAAALAGDGILFIQDEYSRRLFVRQLIRLLDEDDLSVRAPLVVKELYTALLPFSYVSLSYFLIGRGDYAEWVDLQLLMNADLPDLDRAGLKTAIKEAPGVTLPLLHQGIAALIAQRNRNSYRQAVKFSKRMRTIYKKLKRNDEFERWLDWVANDTKRLRAFQEECKKGGLLHD